MKKNLFVLFTFFALGFFVQSASAVPLDFNSQGYSFNDLENNGSFTWANIGGSGVDLTWAIGGNSSDVNDSPSGTGIIIGRNLGFASGANHDYVFTFSQAVQNIAFSILNVNLGPQGAFQYYDLLTFTAGATFSNFGGGVTAVGNQLIPSFGTSDGQMADVAYLASTTGFTITHGNGPNNIDPGFLRFPSITFDVVSVPEPGTLALFGLGIAGMGLMRRRRKV